MNAVNLRIHTYRNVTSGQIVHVVGIHPRLRAGRFESVYEVETATGGKATYTASVFHRLHERVEELGEI